MKVVWSARSRSDLREIGLWIAEDNPVAALAIVRRIRDSARLLSDHPRSGRVGRVADTRERVVAGTSYVIAYRIEGPSVQILAVLHGAQRWPEEFNQVQ